MTLTDPVAALADESSFIGYLTGLAGLGRLVRSAAGPDPHTPGTADEFVHLLLGIAGLGAAVEALAEHAPPRRSP